MSADTTIRRIATIDGEDILLTECDWLHVAPCGCACGIARAEHGSHLIADAEAAMLEFTSTQTKREVERDRAAGFTVRLIKHSDFQAEPSILTVECPHTPKWGVEPIPVPEGHEWAAESRAKTKHLVATRAVYRGDWRAYAEVSQENRRALCGAGSRSASWYADDGRLFFETLQCSRCIAVARKQSVAAAVEAVSA